MISWMKDRLNGSRTRFLEAWRSRGAINSATCGAGDEADCSKNCLKSTTKNMAESDSSSTGETIQLTLLSPIGQSWNTQISPEISIDALRSMALIHFNADPSHNYRMLLVRNKKNLREALTVSAEGLVNKDEILFIISRTDTLRGPDLDNMRAPQEAEILQATAHIPVSQSNSVKAANIEEMVATSELQLEMRKILISLAEHSARVLSAGPSAPQVTKMLRQRLSNSKRADPRALQGLVDMGFSTQAATRALRINNGDAAVALEALLNDSSLSSESDEGSNSVLTSIRDPKSPADYCSVLLSLVHAHAERDFQPHPGYLRDLQAMGFSEAVALKALRATGNNHPAACEWLLGERSRSLFELREGLASDSPVLAALLESPQVQLSLANPKMLLAYLSMLDSHAALNMWLNDPEASPVLSHILRTYHAEKHALAVNQFSSTRQ